MRLTIATVCYNAGKTIGRCIQSILDFKFKDFEYYIIDGNSKDNTICIVDAYREKFKERGIPYHVISEEDSGIYNAMNKAALLAKGEWIIYINADDCLSKECELNAKWFIEERVDVIYGNVIVKTKDRYIYQEAMDVELLRCGYLMPFCHQSTFTRVSAVRKYMFDERYKIIADIDLYLRMLEDGVTFKKIDQYVSVFSNDGLSQTNRLRSISEGRILLKNHHLYFGRRRLVLDLYYSWHLLKRYLPSKLTDVIHDLRSS